MKVKGKRKTTSNWSCRYLKEKLGAATTVDRSFLDLEPENLIGARIRQMRVARDDQFGVIYVTGEELNLTPENPFTISMPREARLCEKGPVVFGTSTAWI